jgi:hypothetical protein
VFHAAAQSYRVKFIQTFLERNLGAHPDLERQRRLDYALLGSAMAGLNQMAFELVDMGADVSFGDYQIFRAAAERRHEKFINAMIKYSIKRFARLN